MLGNFDAAFKRIKESCDSEKEHDKHRALLGKLAECPLVLYGAGEGGRSLAKFFISKNISIECFCDTNKRGIHPEIGIPIISPIQLVKDYPDSNILISSSNFANEIIANLKRLGVSPDRIITSVLLNRSNIKLEQFMQMYDGYKATYDFFQDDMSKDIILGRIKGYLTEYPLFCESPVPFSTNEQYFEPGIVSFTANEVFVDCGVFRGETAISFFERVNNQYCHYYGFEIDPANVQQSTANLAEYSHIDIIQKGLWNHETTLNFNSGDMSVCTISDSGNSIVSATTLDVFFSTKRLNEYPTFIKMDIEGSEKQALLGAEWIIRKLKPKLAISIYHKPEDIYELPELIHRFNPNYRFYLRHYSKAMSETVLYCV